jgi:hypothetical protein
MKSSIHSPLKIQIDLRVDFSDVYSGTFVAPGNVAVESAVKHFFYSIPKFGIWMIQLREFAAKKLGLKTASGRKGTAIEIEQFTGNIGDKIALFEVWNRDANEIVTGQRDKHLDFVLVFKLESNKEVHNLELFTAVQVNSSLGRLYLWAVKPIHKLLMPVILQRLCHRLETAVS